MKKTTLCLLFMSTIGLAGKGLAQDFVDLGKCNLKMTEIREIESFKGEKGDIVKPSRRDSKFVEVKLEGVAYSAGEIAWYPQMFAALFKYRGSVKITPAIALGIKYTDPLTGKKERWFHEPGVSYTEKCKAGDSVTSYVIVEVAKETTDFVLQGPAIIQSLQLKN